MELDRGEVLGFLEADLGRREARFRARVALVLFLASVSLALWQYAITHEPRALLDSWASIAGLSAVAYLFAVGPLALRVRRMLSPPTLPREGSSYGAALGIRMLDTYGLGASGKIDLFLEAGMRLAVGAAVFSMWQVGGGVADWFAFCVIIFFSLNALTALIVALMTMATLRTAWRALKAFLKLEAKPGRNPSEATAKAVEESIRDAVIKAEKILPRAGWRILFGASRRAGNLLHIFMLASAAAIILIATGATSSGPDALVYASQIGPAVLALLVAIWTFREAASSLISFDRALIQQLMVVLVARTRSPRTVMDIYGAIAMAHEENLVVPDRLETVTSDLNLDSHPIDGVGRPAPVEQIAPPDPSPSARGG